eukprot:CAMPEP_0197903464 /NCGR_PEP_ID=MMETSP1439-20131203/56049_1 /TAXON_ID=66791 /ORGANISM="Gonyaulax spinifera, Strain CCMP409" /LENGTH=179 /DNA_ID=CAMNT_0043524591 /DNA_START=10 /DNA_END=547 /DNA_ORIENTATION=+
MDLLLGISASPARPARTSSQLGAPHPAEEQLPPHGVPGLQLAIRGLGVERVLGEHAQEHGPEQGVVDAPVNADLPGVLHLAIAAVGSTAHSLRSPVSNVLQRVDHALLPHLPAAPLRSPGGDVPHSRHRLRGLLADRSVHEGKDEEAAALHCRAGHAGEETGFAVEATGFPARQATILE